MSARNTAKTSRKRKFNYSVEDAEVKAAKQKFKYEAKKQAEDEQLNEILFGGASSFLRSLEEAEQETSMDLNIDSGVGEEDSNDFEHKDRRPAWTDDEDDGIDVGTALNAQKRKLPNGGVNDRKNKYSNLLKNKFVTAYGTPKWASLSREKENSDSDDEILQSCGFIKEMASETLPRGILEYKKVKDLNHETYSEGPYINCIEFSTASSVALVAGNAGIATLYAVDGNRNNKLHSVAFKGYPIMCGQFSQNGQEAILGSKYAHAFCYDLMAAKSIRVPLPTGLTQFKNFVVSPDFKLIAAAGLWGEVHLLSGASKERIALLKQDGIVTSLTFNPLSDLLYGHSDTGVVTVWDMKTRRVRHKWEDEGCIQGTKLAISSSNQFIASGSAQGVVNLYNVEDVLHKTMPKPRKSLLNLTTKITDLKFNATSEILAYASKDIENSVKLYHVGSESTFHNFPNFNTKFGHINVLNFSPSSGYLALGNQKSLISLYRLKHYKNY